jgi:oxaloacetate decarboxylase beta subunit
MALGFTRSHAGAISIIGGGDGITAIFLSAKLAPELIGIIAISAFTYVALIPFIQPPVMKLLTTKKERLIRMKPMRVVSKMEKVVFPLIGILLTCFIVPAALPLLGMLFFGNLFKESGVTKRLAETVKGPMIDVVTILIGLTIGASAEASVILTSKALSIFVLGAFSFMIATVGGVLFVKFINIFLKAESRINPLIGNAGLATLPDSARVSHVIGLKYDKTNFLLMHAMGPNVAGIIGSALAAGVILTFLY